MFLTVENFKSIESVRNVDISNLTVLAGVNSSGKSSLIQALLLLKQTLTQRSDQKLILSGPYVYAGNPMDLIYKKNKGLMGFGLKIEAKELIDTPLYQAYGGWIESLRVEVKFEVKPDTLNVAEFTIEVKPFIQNVVAESIQLPYYMSVKRKPRKGTYDIEYGDTITRDVEIAPNRFENFFPTMSRKNGFIAEYELPTLVRQALKTVLKKVVYLAPLRVAPVLARTYNENEEKNFILPDGSNTRLVLDEISRHEKETFDLIKFWICNKLQLAKDLKVVKESGDRYKVFVTSNDGVKVDLMHMGFGLSQILPVVTQGCLSLPHSLLIVEEPDAHMHPSIQAAMADFMIFIHKERKVSLLVETHSDHFITRLRRRVAEGEISYEALNLIYVENLYGASIYKKVAISDNGRFNGAMPPGFLDSLDEDYRAILMANRYEDQRRSSAVSAG